MLLIGLWDLIRLLSTQKMLQCFLNKIVSRLGASMTDSATARYRDGREIERSGEKIRAAGWQGGWGIKRERAKEERWSWGRRDSLSSASTPHPLGIVIGFRCSNTFSVLLRLTVLHTLTLQFCIQYIARFAINQFHTGSSFIIHLFACSRTFFRRSNTFAHKLVHASAFWTIPFRTLVSASTISFKNGCD